MLYRMRRAECRFRAERGASHPLQLEDVDRFIDPCQPARHNAGKDLLLLRDGFGLALDGGRTRTAFFCAR